MAGRSVLLVLSLLSVACGAPDPDLPVQESEAAGTPLPPIETETSAMVDLSGTSWRMENLAGTDVPDGVLITMDFSPDGQVSGSGGCNRFTGTYSRDGDQLSFGPIASTRMACPGAAMDLETQFHVLLDGGLRYEWTEGDELLLFPEDGGPASRLSSLAG